MAIINPTEEITTLTEDIDYLETKIEILTEAEAGGQELNSIDIKAMDVYSQINELQLELLDFIEAEQGSIETGPVDASNDTATTTN